MMVRTMSPTPQQVADAARKSDALAQIFAARTFLTLLGVAPEFAATAGEQPATPEPLLPAVRRKRQYRARRGQPEKIVVALLSACSDADGPLTAYELMVKACRGTNMRRYRKNPRSTALYAAMKTCAKRGWLTQTPHKSPYNGKASFSYEITPLGLSVRDKIRDGKFAYRGSAKGWSAI